MNTVSRRSFLKTAGLATGAAAVAASPGRGGTAAERCRDDAHQPDAARADHRRHPRRERGEVTVLSGTTEKTYRTRFSSGGCSRRPRRTTSRKKQGVA